jgi:serpin B
MKKISILSSILPAILFAAFACDTDEPKPAKRERKDIVLTKAETEIVKQNNAFAFNLLRSVSQLEKPESNFLLSPLSATLALAMLNNGADGQTQQEIQQALGYADITRDETNAYFRKMITALKEADTDATFETANSIWIRNGIPVLETFKDVNREYYEAEVRNEDFSNPKTPGLINSWCADRTHNKIPEILDYIDGNTVMFLINALYFKASWAFPFNRDLTAREYFTRSGGLKTMTSVMNLERSLVHGESEDFDLLELPYGNGTFSMLLLLPREGLPLSSVLKTLDAETWANSLARMYTKEVELKLPLFRVEYERELNEDLKAMGMEQMFTRRADFSLIRPEGDLLVSKVKQKTFVEVNEEGAEAAAITVIDMDLASAAPPEDTPVRFYATRPFLYFIREQSAGAILFAGALQQT